MWLILVGNFIISLGMKGPQLSEQRIIVCAASDSHFIKYWVLHGMGYIDTLYGLILDKVGQLWLMSSFLLEVSPR